MRAAMLLLVCLALMAEPVDKLAISVGQTVITELQIDEDLRVAALLNGQPIHRDNESRRAAADRLVEQMLIQHEIDLSRYPPPSDQDLTTLYSSVVETLGGQDPFKRMLDKYSVSDSTLRAHLLAQLSTIRFIDVRFAPDITISDNEIETAYQREVRAIRASSPDGKSPPLDAAERVKLSNALLGERTDAALNSWLAESRKQVNIVYLDATLQ